jgi:hypothetical protein
MVKKKGWWVNINDKIEISKTRYCPPHYLPHKFPIGEKITDETCHIHESGLRMAHHVYFCNALNCSNYAFMIQEKLKHAKRDKTKNLEKNIS